MSDPLRSAERGYRGEVDMHLFTLQWCRGNTYKHKYMKTVHLAIGSGKDSPTLCGAKCPNDCNGWSTGSDPFHANCRRCLRRRDVKKKLALYQAYLDASVRLPAQTDR